MPFEVVGISGKAGSGKDFISQHFFKPLGYHQFSLAWHFKVGLVGKGLATYEEVFVAKPPHVRKMLQEEGTENGRMIFGENVWVDTMSTWFTLLNEHWGIDKFVIPDVRFPNEATAITAFGGKVFRIEAPVRVSRNTLNAEARRHISETALDHYQDFNGTILNDPRYEETVKKQICDLIGEEIEAQSLVWDTVDIVMEKWDGFLQQFKKEDK